MHLLLLLHLVLLLLLHLLLLLLYLLLLLQRLMVLLLLLLLLVVRDLLLLRLQNRRGEGARLAAPGWHRWRDDRQSKTGLAGLQCVTARRPGLVASLSLASAFVRENRR